jgi:hypothetical protein
MKCDSQDSTLHSVLSDVVATVRQDPSVRVLSRPKFSLSSGRGI